MTELALVETKTGYVELDALVDAAEGDGIRARWEFGKAVLQERGESRLLPRGRTAEIAEMIGKAMSEVQARTNFAEEFPTEEKLSHAVREFGSWHAIRNRPRGEGRSTEPKPDPSADGQIMEHLEAVKKLIPKWEEGFVDPHKPRRCRQRVEIASFVARWLEEEFMPAHAAKLTPLPTAPMSAGGDYK